MMMRKVELFLLKRHRTTWKSLLLCFILLLVKVVPSSSQTISPSTHTPTILQKFVSSSLMSIIVPTPSPLPQYTCQSGPDTMSTIFLIVGVVAPSLIIILIVILVTTSIICVYCKRYLKYKKFYSGERVYM